MDEQNEDLDNLCPLCMEEMDVTDRHLRPCQCGYQICVWCWHQIMELATKDHTEGRCPACRTQYDKDKVVGTRLNCEELMDLAVDKKKSHKSKAKAQEGRKHLSNVRVVQRNLVYVVGFPSNLADEETLERREFFGQYGKILKVAVSRSGQHSHNGPSASVYVTFVKEEDAVRCIKVVDGCIFEGKLLRACFGTNKYCNAWLKNMSCNNPDCLYLHDEGPDEDSYTKEEMLAKYGSKSQYFHDLTKPPHRAVGVGLPPPVFEASTSSTPVVTTQSQNVSGSSNRNSAAKVTTSPGGPGKLTSLPAAASWGLRGTPVKAAVTKAQVSGGSRKKAYGSIVPKPLTSAACHSAKEFEEEEVSTASSYVSTTNVSDRALGEDYTSTSLSDRYNTEPKGEDQIDPSEESSSPENDGFRSATSSEMQHTRSLNLSGGSFGAQTDYDSYKQAEGSLQCPFWLGSDRSESAGMASPERLSKIGASICSTEERMSCDRPLSLNVGEVSISLISNSSEHSGEPSHAPSAEASSSESMKLQESVDRDSYSDDVMRALERIDLGGEPLTEMDASRIPSSSQADTGKPGENNIIADILTMDFSTDGELSPGDLTKFFLTGKSTDSKPSENYSSHGKQQSRFSFARQDSSGSTVGGIEPTVSSRSFSKFMSEEQHSVSFNNSLDEASHFGSRDSLSKSSSFQSTGSELFGQTSASKSRLFAPPGFAGTCSVPPPGFSVRNVNNTPQTPAGTRPYDFELIDPAIMAVGRGAIQNEHLNRTIRNQPKPDIRQLFPSSNVDDILGLGLISQQQSGVLDFDSMLKQQHQQQRLSMNDPRKVPFKFAASDNLVHGESGSLARMSGQYEDGYVSPYAAAAARSYRSLSSLDSSWLGYGADAFAPEGLPKLKSSLRGTTAGLGTSGFSGSIRQGDGKSMFLSNGNQSMPTMDHYMAEQSFREADIQGAFV